MKVVFVCAPFRASTPWEVERNVRQAEEMSLALWKSGFAVICPQANSRYFDKSCPDEAFLEGYKEILKRCDAALQWNGPASPGMRAELTAASGGRIPVFQSLEALIEWANK